MEDMQASKTTITNIDDERTKYTKQASIYCYTILPLQSTACTGHIRYTVYLPEATSIQTIA